MADSKPKSVWDSSLWPDPGEIMFTIISPDDLLNPSFQDIVRDELKRISSRRNISPTKLAKEIGITHRILKKILDPNAKVHWYLATADKIMKFINNTEIPRCESN